jgi:Domain of unknown function (DUF4279)
VIHQKVASVALIIAGTGLDLERVSEELQVEPTHVHRIGERNMIGQPFPHDMWQLETEVDENESLDTHLRYLTAKLKPHYPYLCSLKALADVYVYCGVNCDSDQCGFSLSSEALTMFTELGISLEITVLTGVGTRQA